MKKLIVSALCIVMLAVILVNTAGCGVSVAAADLMDGITSSAVAGKPADDKFVRNSADFAVDLFKQAIAENKNSLVSPLSIMLALAMTANGADGVTKTQMEKLLGGDIELQELNEYIYTYVKSLPSEEGAELRIANSIWFRDASDRLSVKDSFLQTNANYYNAAAYKAAFDKKTMDDINNWAKKNTDGMIDKIIDQISANTVMYLINALVFNAEWEEAYDKNSIIDGEFNAVDGQKQKVEMMHSEEYRYISDGKATGFIKDYKGGTYSFVALLPDESVNINDYVASLSGEGLMLAVKNVQNVPVSAQLPKFSYDYTVSLNKQLMQLGMPAAFDPDTADFSRLADSKDGNIVISDVLHKTFIAVDELGTKAGAVTKVEMKNTGMPEELREVILDRPFVYAIVENTNNLPVFIGTVMSFN